MDITTLILRVIVLILQGTNIYNAVTDISDQYQVDYNELWNKIPDSWKH